MNLLPELGFGCLTENEDFFMNCLARYVIEKGEAFNGYYGAYIWKNIGDVEMNFHLLPGEQSYNVVGFTSHVSGNQMWQLAVADTCQHFADDDCDSVLERWVTFTHPLTQEGNIRIYLVNADVVPDFFPNDTLTVQVIAVAGDVTYYRDEAAYDESEPLTELMGKPVHFAVNNVFSIINGSVAVGVIKKVSAHICSDEKGEMKEFCCTTISTSFGTLEIMHAKESVKEEEKAFMRPGGVVKALCTILGDVAIGKYQKGAIYDQEHMARLLRSCVDCRDFTRITNVLADDCRYVARSGEVLATGKTAVLDYLSNAAKKQREQESDCRAYPAVVSGIESTASDDSLHEFPIGSHCVALAQNEEGKIDTILFVKLDDEKKMAEIKNAGEKEAAYQITVNMGRCPGEDDDLHAIQTVHSEREWLKIIQDCYEKGHFDDIEFYYGMLPDCVLESDVKSELFISLPIHSREPVFTYLSSRITHSDHIIKCEIMSGKQWGHEFALKTDIDSSAHITTIDLDEEGHIARLHEFAICPIIK